MGEGREKEEGRGKGEGRGWGRKGKGRKRKGKEAEGREGRREGYPPNENLGYGRAGMPIWVNSKNVSLKLKCFPHGPGTVPWGNISTWREPYFSGTLHYVSCMIRTSLFGFFFITGPIVAACTVSALHYIPIESTGYCIYMHDVVRLC